MEKKVEYSKEERLWQFNSLFEKLLREIQELFPKDEVLKSKIDVILKEVKNKLTVVIVNNFTAFGCDDKEISAALKRHDIEFFVNYSREKYKAKFGTEQFYDIVMGIPGRITDKKKFITKVDDLRKVANTYNKL